MAITETSTIGINRIPDDWDFQPTDEQREGESFSANAVINAYLKGRKDQYHDNEKILAEKLNENLNKAMNLSSSFSDILQDKKIKCLHILLMPKNIMEFESIFVVDENDYISPQFEEIYKLAILEKAKANGDTFHFSYIFIPYSKNLNRQKLKSDGYILEYVKK